MNKEITVIEGAIGMLGLLARLAIYLLLCVGVAYLLIPVYNQGIVGMLISALIFVFVATPVMTRICFDDLE
jgi:hypothetical protein